MSRDLRETEALWKLVERTTRSGTASCHADLCINFAEWQWHQGVALYGLMKASASLGDEAGRRFVREWVDAKLASGERPKSINTTAPVLAIAALHELSPKPEYREVCDEYAEWCMAKAPRLPDGTFEHSCTANRYPLQVWADTLFMGGIFLAKWGMKPGNRRYADEAARQFANHYHYLHDDATGLIVHGYDGATGSQKGVLWGRGNGWFTAASIDVLGMFPAGSVERTLLEGNFRRHLDGVMATQDACGAWHTVMNDRSTYLEMSATAAFAMGLRWAGGQRWGEPRHRAAADRAYAVLLSRISPDGELLDASGGTPVMPAAADYNAVPFAVTCFSQGLAMLALSLPARSGK
jgi:unsaturated rhamnogalacturonyl hydrolase